MEALYLDSSAFIAMLFRERHGSAVEKQLGAAERVLSSNLLESEVRAACIREQVDLDDALLDGIAWILPDRPLTPELKRVFTAGYVRGADAWHLGCALYLPIEPAELLFLTEDEKQRDAAKRLGFRVD